MSEEQFDADKSAKLARTAHKDAVDREVKKTITKNEYYDVIDDNDILRARFGKINKGIFGMKIFDSNGDVVYEISDDSVTFRNVLPYNFDDSLDDSYPLECEFYMPSGVTKINSCWVHIVGRNFRAYSKGAASGGGQTSSSGGGQTTSSGGGQTSSGGSAHSHTVSGQTASNSGSHSHTINDVENTHTTTENTWHDHTFSLESANTGYTSKGSGNFSSHRHNFNRREATGGAENQTHYHNYIRCIGINSSGEHSHSVTGTTSSSESSHTHTVDNHTHTVSNHTHTVSNHTHSLTFGIYESTDPTGVNIYVDDGEGYGDSVSSDDTPVLIDVNIADGLTTTEGWKKIRITSSRLGRVVLVAILDIVISNT